MSNGNRELTGVEKSIIRAIVADAGSKAVIEEMLAIANEYVAEAGLAPKIDAATAQIKAEEKADLDREAAVARQAKADEVSQIIDGAPSTLPATPSALVVGLTVREVGMLVKIAEDECHDSPTEPTWLTGISTCKADNAIIGSLNKKGMAMSFGSGREGTIQLTDKGLVAYRAAKCLPPK